MKDLKWNGWGKKTVFFPAHSRPHLWTFIESKLGVKAIKQNLATSIDRINLQDSLLNSEQLGFFKKFEFSIEKEMRLHHAYGKSFPDIFRARQGVFKKVPDAVVWPQSKEEIILILNYCMENKLTLIVYGGGTNIVGSLECLDIRPSISLNMQKMRKLISIDKVSQLAKFQAGVKGPDLEDQLQEQGFCLGHTPDSFEFSTLGGWIATRSAGMQSDEYGRIEDLVEGLSFVTTKGLWNFKDGHAKSAGPNWKEVILGSEGTLGVIAEATVKVHHLPPYKKTVGFLFPDFQSAVLSLQECYHQRVLPSLCRIQDEDETELASHLRESENGWQQGVRKLVKIYARSKGIRRPALVICGFEGEKSEASYRYKVVKKIFKETSKKSGHHFIFLGDSVGNKWSKDKYFTPYLRDYVMEYNLICDVAESTFSWHQIHHVYPVIKQNMKEFFLTKKIKGYLGCHLSHSYPSGACLYFTFACDGGDTLQTLDLYYEIKKRMTDLFIDHGTSLSHHHAVGIDHQKWINQEWGPLGNSAFIKMKELLDPSNILNPGKIYPTVVSKT